MKTVTLGPESGTKTGTKRRRQTIAVSRFRIGCVIAYFDANICTWAKMKKSAGGREIRFDPGTVFLRKRKWVEFFAANRDYVLRSFDGR